MKKTDATSGFIYLWYDRKKKRFYLGKHWGTLDDRYVCSSVWMLQAYKKRPEDFKRRVLEWCSTRDDLRVAEERWGLLIKPEELKTRYYNLKQPSDRHWHDDPDKLLTVSEKISKRTREAMADPMIRAKVSAGVNAAMTDEVRAKISAAKKGVPNPKHAEAMRGRKHSIEHRAKISASSRIAQQKGVYHTPFGDFTGRSDMIDNGMNFYFIVDRCTRPDDVFQCRTKNVPAEWVGRTSREVGFWFEELS